MLWFTLGLLTLLGFTSANARADSSKRWNAADPKVCFGPTTESPVAMCLGMYVRIDIGSRQAQQMQLAISVCKSVDMSMYLSAEDDTLLEWRVEFDCTVPNTLTVRYTDGHGDTIESYGFINAREVRLECSHDANQVVVGVFKI